VALLNLSDAQTWVTERCQALPSIEIAVADALGCILNEDVYATEQVPPFANTAMDGFAVRAADVVTVPCDLMVIGTLAAGAAPGPQHVVGPGQAIRIMTGAVLPSGADAIVPVENIDPLYTDDSQVRVLESASLGAAVRPAGEDIAAGQLVFPRGTQLNAGHLGVLASIGRSHLHAYRRVRVGVLSTGDELVSPPAPLGPGQIRDSNRQTLMALARQANCEVVDLGLAVDTEADIEAKVLSALETCDALVTSGGVSMGDFDYVKVVLDRLSKADREPGRAGKSGSEEVCEPTSEAVSEPISEPMRWMQIAIKPAKPLAFGLIEGKPVFGLPGNPVSSMVSFELFARAGLRSMMGHAPENLHRKSVPAIVDEDLRRGPDGKIHFARVTAAFAADGRIHVRSSGGQASNLLRSMALADALAVLPDGPTIPAGGEVQVLLLDRPS
jgi:molybdopterin molybdotransferase